MNGYVVIFGIANKIHTFQRLIPLKKSFQFQFLVGLADMRALKINNVIGPKQINKYCVSSNTTSNIYMKHFKCRKTSLYHGTAPKTSLMIPPVSVEDDTTNKGEAKVMLLVLAMFGILGVT